MKNIRPFYPKIFIFLVVKFSVYLNRHVFVMLTDGPNEDSNQPVHPRSVNSVFAVRMKKFCILDYSRMHPVKVLIRLRECTG